MRKLRLLLPLILAGLAAAGGSAHARPAGYVPGELIVRWRDGARLAERAALVRERSARPLHRFRLIDAELIAVDGDAAQVMAAFAADPRVASVERNAIVSADAVPNDPRFPELWGLRNTGQTGGTPGADVDALAAWDVTTGDPGLRVGVIDSGIDYAHPDLAANMWVNPGEVPGNGLDDDGNGYADDVHGYDFANNDPDPFDDAGHGTHVAGTIAAVGDNGIGVTGLAWRGSLVAIKFLDSAGNGTTANAIRALEYSVAIGLRITNNSWGGPENSAALRAAIEAAGAAGQLFVAAAGNRAADNDLMPHYPSSFRLPNLISVASTTALDQISSFSNYGIVSVDIAAPGSAIVSTLPGERYGTLSGTSMATPLVAATAALLMGRVPAILPEQIRTRLLGTAEVLPDLQGRIAGARRLNTLRAIADPDTVAPGAVTALAAGDAGSNTVRLTWVATGDDGDQGRATEYDIRFALAPITAATFDSATRVPGPVPAPPGVPEAFEIRGLETNTAYWFSVRARDEFNNPGPLVASASATTLGPPAIALSPEQFLTPIAVGDRDTLTLTVTNTAEGTLDFTVPEAALAFPPGGLVAQSIAFDGAAKGDAGAPGPPVTANAGGPDAAGYRWIDSRDPGGPLFQWIDVTADGARIPLTGDDEVSGPIDLGFDFPFYGTSVRTVHVSTNGVLAFGPGAAAPVNQGLPSPGGPPAAIAPFWDDLHFASLERAWMRREPGRFVLTWLAVPHYGGGGPYTFQAVLLENGEILFQYLAMGTMTLSATAGIQNAARDVGLTVAHNTAFFKDSLAVRIVPLPQWVRVAPIAGRVHAGASLDLAVALDARGLTGGTYDATLRIRSNDPSAPERSVPLRIAAIGAPDLVTEPLSLSFGELFAGGEAERSLRVRNPGSEWLHVTGVGSSHPYVTVSDSVFSIGPSGFRDMTVRCRPPTAGSLTGQLMLASNVAGGMQHAVPFTATVLPPPRFAIDPPSIGVSLPPAGQVTRSVRIDNPGDSPLTFTARAAADPGGASAGVAAGRAAPGAYVPDAKRAPDRHAGETPGAEGGPDAFGYTYRTSAAPNGPAFAWVDATAGGLPVPLQGDDVTSGPIAIGFEFPFYGTPQTALRVCTNGWISFTSTLAAFGNTMLPSDAPGVPENLIAPYWDDFHFAESGRVWILREPARTVIQFTEVGRLDDASRPNTFQAILHRDGRIRFQYLRMKGQNLTSGTVGIQNAARDDGITVAYNAAFARDSLAVEFVPPAGWFDVVPAAGTVPPGGAAELDVTLRSSGLFAGTYGGHVRFTTNDPLAPEPALPCTLRVEGAHALAAQPETLEVARAFVGFPSVHTVRVLNGGTAAFMAASATSPHPAVSARLLTPSIPPEAAGTLEVTIAAGAAGSIETFVDLDVVEGPALRVPVRAQAMPAPVAGIETPQLHATLANGLGDPAATGVRRIAIENTGGSPLGWSAAARLIDLPAEDPARAMRAARAATRPKGAAAAAGAIGAPGPDAAGYHWTDSRTPGAPAFGWIDAAAGVPVALDRDDQLSAPLALPFPFPFYDGVHDSVRVSSNGFLVFAAADPAYANTVLPSPLAPAPMIAPCWDDFDLRSAAGEGRVRAVDLGDRFVIAFLDVPRFGGTDPHTFQVVLGANGDIDFQYLDVPAPADQATIGIQNAQGDVGLLVAHDTAFLESGLRVAIRRRAPWLAIEPAQGTVAPGETDSITVRFRALEHADGAYSGSVRIVTDDPALPARVLPAFMQIGRVGASLDLDLAPGAAGERHVAARILPEPGPPAAAWAAARPALLGVGPAGVPGVLPGGAIEYRYPRPAVLRALAEGTAVVADLLGAVPGFGWVSAADTLSFVPPEVIDDGLPPFEGGRPVTLAWLADPGQTVDVAFSGDGIAWTSIGDDLATGTLSFTPPRAGTPAGWLELSAFGASGYAGSALIGPFEVIPGEPLPLAFGVRVTGLHPARVPVALALAMPAAGVARIDVFNITGARVATLADRAFAAGTHRIEWNGLDRSGGPAPAGVYFVRGSSPLGEARTRVVLLR